MNVSQHFEPNGATLAESIQNAPLRYPANGFTFQNMAGEERFFSFGEFEAETAVRAKALQDIGIQKGDRIGLVVIEPQDFVLSFLASSRIGAVPVPLYPPVRLGRLDEYVFWQHPC